MIIVGLDKDVAVKKVSFLCLMVGLLCANNGFGSSYYLWGSQQLVGGTAAYNAWGAPSLSVSFIQDSNIGPGKFRIKEGWAWAGTKAGDAENNESLRDDKSVMVFVAKDIYEHGGWFCLTQLAAISSNSSFQIVNQQPNWPGMNCMAFCEPGWDGFMCSQSVSGTAVDLACNTTDVVSSIEKVKQEKYKNNDALSLHWQRMGTASTQDFFVRYFVNNFYEHVVYLGATDFMTHGIVAQPVLVSAVGNHPAVTVVNSGPAATGKTKVLCAQGFTRNDKCEMNSKNCGSNVWCNGYSDSGFKSNIHVKQMKGRCNVIVCKDGSKALDSSFNCVDYDGIRNGRCDVSENELYGKYIGCDEGKIYDDATCKCVVARSVSKEIMQYGPAGASALVNEQCWTKETVEDFQNCVFGIVPVVSDDDQKD